MGTARGMTGGVSRAQPRRQQASGMAFEDQHGAIQVLGIAAVEEAELLLAMGRIVGGIEIEQNLTALADLVAAESDELLAQQVVPVHQIAGGRRVLPAAESRLRAQRVAQFLIGDDLQHGIVAQMVGVVGFFISGHALIDALPSQRQRIMAHAVVLTGIAELRRQFTGEMMALIDGPQRQQTGIAGDLAPRKNRRGWVDDGRRSSSVVVEHVASSDGWSERGCVFEPSVHQSFRASLLFWLEAS
jgi:hypothetical protein